VLLLACGYFCSNYVFYMFSNWLFTYLVESRGFPSPSSTKREKTADSREGTGCRRLHCGTSME
jgi:hypothetical protein